MTIIADIKTSAKWLYRDFIKSCETTEMTQAKLILMLLRTKITTLIIRDSLIIS